MWSNYSAQLLMFNSFAFYTGKEWRKRQIRKITDRVFDKVQNQKETENLSFQDLYIAVLLVYK